jgi:hypothetical protein
LPVLRIAARIVVGIYLAVLHARLPSIGFFARGCFTGSMLASSERQRQIPSSALGSGPF